MRTSLVVSHVHCTWTVSSRHPREACWRYGGARSAHRIGDGRHRDMRLARIRGEAVVIGPARRHAQLTAGGKMRELALQREPPG